jgi:predicted nucleic acid-binding protein
MIEYQAVLARPEHLEAARVPAGDVDEILSALSAVLEPIRLAYLWRPLLRDPADEMVLEMAVNGGADLLCTLNIRDFEPARRFGIPVLNPGEAWLRVEAFHEKK